MSWLLDAEPAPKILVLPPAVADLGEAEAAIELWEHYSRKTLDPSQRLVVQVLMAQAADGRWAASTTGREMPRQNGKGDEIEVVELWGLVQRGEAILHTVHDAVLLATQTQERMLGVIEGHPDLRRKIGRVWRGTGQQMIEMVNGGVIWYRTRTNGGARGVDNVDRLVVDEAQHATSEHLASLSPTLLANPNSQLNAMGTSGLDGMSGWWWSIRKRALTPDPGAFGYIGHTAETVRLDDDGKVQRDPVDASDRRHWVDTNPAVASGRGGAMEFLEEQYRRLGPKLFAQEHLGVWADPPPDDECGPTWQVWSEAEWTACASEEVDADPAGWLVGPVSVAVERSYVGPEVAIVVAGECREGGIGVVVAAIGRGTEWAVQKLLAMKADESRPVGRIVIDLKGPSGAMKEHIEAAGIEFTAVSFPDYQQATGDFSDAVAAVAVRHRDPEMTEAVKHAIARRVGDAWLIDRRTGEDVSPLTAAVLARWGFLQSAQVVDLAGQVF